MGGSHSSMSATVIVLSVSSSVLRFAVLVRVRIADITYPASEIPKAATNPPTEDPNSVNIPTNQV